MTMSGISVWRKQGICRQVPSCTISLLQSLETALLQILELCGTPFGLLSVMTLGICFRLMPIFQSHLMNRSRTVAFILLINSLLRLERGFSSGQGQQAYHRWLVIGVAS